MSLDIVGLHKLIDKWANEQAQPTLQGEATIEPPPVERVLPEGRRMVRTKAQGDKAFYIDEEKKTRQAILGQQGGRDIGPEIVESLGFTMSDIEEIEDGELLRYQMGPSIYKVVENG